MAYLEQQCVVHRDVRAENIFVGNDKILKVGDFGLAHLMGEKAGGMFGFPINKFQLNSYN